MESICLVPFKKLLLLLESRTLPISAKKYILMRVLCFFLRTARILEHVIGEVVVECCCTAFDSQTLECL